MQLDSICKQSCVYTHSCVHTAVHTPVQTMSPASRPVLVLPDGTRAYWIMSFRQIEQFEVVGNSTIIFEAPFSTRNA